MADCALRLGAVRRSYRSGPARVQVLAGADLEVARGERVAIMGASGSGKSTLLHIAGGMDLPDDGWVEVLGQRVNELPEPRRTRFRARHVGLVFQDYNLLDGLSAAENIELVLWLNGLRSIPGRLQRVRELAGELGISKLLDRRPDQMSGGEQQRVAIARALIHEPDLVLADEPTGSLDEASASSVLDLLAAAAAGRGCALVLVTHNAAAAARCDRILKLTGGRLVDDGQ